MTLAQVTSPVWSLAVALVVSGCGTVEAIDDADANTCDSDFDTDPSNCGACGSVCGLVDNGTPGCSGGECVAQCSSGFDDCDGDYATGCETSLTNREDCGGCGVACEALQRCEGETPACVGVGAILFGRSHNNFSGYGTFISLLENEGYTVTNNDAPISGSTLTGVSVLVLAIATEATAYAESELIAIEEAVEAGMGLLLLTDIGPHHVEADPIATRFALSFGADFAIGVMSIESHPVTTGVTALIRDPSAAAILSDAQTAPLLFNADGAFLSATPDGGAETVLGRVIMLTEINLLADFYSGAENPMTDPGADNATLGLNAIGWLSQLR
jgi:hypothetical protein